MIRSTLRAAPAALLVALALAGCSPDARPVARVGRHTLTVADFLRAARRAQERMPLPAEQARPLLLQQMVTNELLLVAAESHGLDTTVIAQNRLRAATEQALLGALSAQISPPDPGVTEAEVRTLYEWRRTQSDVQIIYAPDSATVFHARRLVDGGAPFGRIADDFAGPGVLPPGGQLGFRLPGSLPQPVDDAMRTQPVGRIGGPYHAPMGWFLVLVTGRAPAPVRPFEQERASLEALIRQRKWQSALLDGVTRLGTAWHLSLAPDAGQSLFHLLTPLRVGGLGDPAPAGADRARVLARFDGGTFTLGDAWDDLRRPEITRPNSSLVPSLAQWVRDRAVVRIALAEARRRHLHEDPAVAGALTDQMNELLLQTEYGIAIAGVVAPDEATLRATWEPVKDRFPQMRQARVLWAVVADTAKAMAVGQRSGEGTLREAARAVDPAIVVHEETLRFPNGDPRWSAAQGTLQQLEPGQWAGPEFTASGIRIVELVDKVQAPVPWEELPTEVRQSLANNLLQRSRDARVAAYTDSLRRAVNPVVMPEALRNVQWPVPGGTTP